MFHYDSYEMQMTPQCPCSRTYKSYHSTSINLESKASIGSHDNKLTERAGLSQSRITEGLVRKGLVSRVSFKPLRYLILNLDIQIQDLIQILESDIQIQYLDVRIQDLDIQIQDLMSKSRIWTSKSRIWRPQLGFDVQIQDLTSKSRIWHPNPGFGK